MSTSTKPSRGDTILARLDTILASYTYTLAALPCPHHGADAPHYAAPEHLAAPLCSLCITAVRQRVATGRRGGQVGGRSMSPAKVAQWRAAQAKRHPQTDADVPVPECDPGLSRADNVRQALRAGARQAEIARAYGVSRQWVSSVWRRMNGAGAVRD